MKTPSPLQLGTVALAASTASGFLIPSTLSAPNAIDLISDSIHNDKPQNENVKLRVHVIDATEAEGTSIGLFKDAEGKPYFDRVFSSLPHVEGEEHKDEGEDGVMAEAAKFLPFTSTTPHSDKLWAALKDMIPNHREHDEHHGEEHYEGREREHGRKHHDDAEEGRKHGEEHGPDHGREHHREHDDRKPDDREHHRDHDKEHHHRHHGPHPHHNHTAPTSVRMGCAELPSFLSKTFCNARAFVHDLAHPPPHGPRRSGSCHHSHKGMPRPELQSEGLIAPPSFPEGFPKPKGGPLKFLPGKRPDGSQAADDLEAVSVSESTTGEPEADAGRDWEAYYGRPHHGHHHGGHHHHNPIMSALHWIVFSIVIPVFIGVAAGMLASAVGMVFGTAIAWCWIRFVRGGKRGEVAGNVVVLSEKERLLALDADVEAEAEAVVDGNEKGDVVVVVVEEAPPVYVEKA